MKVTPHFTRTILPPLSEYPSDAYEAIREEDKKHGEDATSSNLYPQPSGIPERRETVALYPQSYILVEKRRARR